MKTKNRSSYKEDFVSTKKKFSKCHDPLSRKSKQFDTGVVADKFGRLINVGAWVSFPHGEFFLEGEVVEIHSENKLTLLYDNPDTNEFVTYNVSAWDVTLLN